MTTANPALFPQLKDRHLIRHAIGVAIGFLGGWLLWNVGGAVFHEIGAGASIWHSLTYPPMTLRLMAALAAFIAGIATLTNFSTIGIWLAGIATFKFGVFSVALLAHAQNVTEHADKLVYLACLTALFLGLFVTRKRSQRKD